MTVYPDLSVVSLSEGAAPVPPRLRASLERHQANLGGMVHGRRNAGMDEPAIEASVGVLAESYRLELLEAMKTLATMAEAKADR